jgi:hypothetical protein
VNYFARDIVVEIYINLNGVEY